MSRHRRQDRHRGVTLVELTLSVSVMAVLMGGVMSAVMIASRALPDSSRPVSAAIAAADAVARMSGELCYAETFTERAASAVTFTVADRDGDAIPEAIRYAWSGTPGDPLTRRYNLGTAVTIADAVNTFDLVYILGARDKNLAASQNESAETVLFSLEGVTSLANMPIATTQGLGEYFLPSFPADAVSWKVTRVRFKAGSSGAVDGQTAVQLRLPTAGNLPSTTVIDEYVLQESSLTTELLWRQAPFSRASGLSPTEGLCLVFAHVTGIASCAVEYQSASAVVANAAMLQYDGAWKSASGQALQVYIYGTITTKTPAQAGSVSYVSGVDVTLGLGVNGAARVHALARPLNEPEITGP